MLVSLECCMFCWNKNLVLISLRYLRYNLIEPSVSPNEFLATHLYWPKSAMSTSIIVNFITTLYTFSNTSCTYLLPKRINREMKRVNYKRHNKLGMIRLSDDLKMVVMVIGLASCALKYNARIAFVHAALRFNPFLCKKRTTRKEKSESGQSWFRPKKRRNCVQCLLCLLSLARMTSTCAKRVFLNETWCTMKATIWK